MIKMKRITLIFISIILIFSTFITASATNTEDENYKLLIEQGFSADHLDGLTDSMMNKMAEEIKKASNPEYIGDYEYLLFLGIPEEFINELSETSLSRIKKSLSSSKISKLDYKKEKAPSSDALIKKLSLQLTDESGSSVLGETVCVYWEHEPNKPIIRDEDFITASWNKDFFHYDPDSFYAEDYRRNATDKKWSVSESYNVLATASLNSIGYWTKLYTTKKQVGGFMIFNLSPTHPINANDNYDRTVNIDYTYATETKSFSTVVLCIVFILLALTSLSVIIKFRNKKRK